jgi:hypothetical protein
VKSINILNQRASEILYLEIISKGPSSEVTSHQANNIVSTLKFGRKKVATSTI